MFNYRHPFDILVSEANYFHVDGKSPLAALLGAMPYEQRLARLTDDKWLLGSLRDRIGAFIPGIECGNVVPVSFEELVGGAGGGSDQVLDDVIWSLQLKLQAPGRPGEIRARISERGGATFREGRIGGWRGGLPDEIVGKLTSMPQDYLEAFGYDAHQSGLSWRTEEFRHRPLRLSRFDPRGTPFIAETEYFGHNIVAFRGRYYAIANALGPLSLDELSENELARFPSSESISAVRSQVARRAILGGTESAEFIAEQAAHVAEQVREQVAPELQRRVTAAVEDMSTRFAAEVDSRLAHRLAQETQALETVFARLLEDRIGTLEAALAKATADRAQALDVAHAKVVEALANVVEARTRRLEHRLQAQEDRLRQTAAARAAEIEARLTRTVAELDGRLRQSVADLLAPPPPAPRGAFLRYNLFKRADSLIAVPWRLGAVDPRQPAVADTPGVLARRAPLALRLKIAWAWVRWAYWDGARI